jgi:iron complex transport system substrate-binding protein
MDRSSGDPRSARSSPPCRIATLLASATEIVFGLGLGDRVVAVSHECDAPPEAAARPRVTRSNVDSTADSGAIDSQVKELHESGRPLYAIDEERLAALAPDLIVTQAQCDVCAVRYEDVLAAVAGNSSLKNTRVVPLNPMSLEDVLGDILLVGRAAGAVDAAERYIGQLKNRVAAVRDRTENLAPDQRPKVAIIEWSEPLMLAANWTPELVEIAGGVHGLTTSGRHSTYANPRDLVQYDPELIIVAPCGFDLARSLQEVDELAMRDWWREGFAAAKVRVVAVDGNAYFNRSGPRLVDTLEILAHLIHPDRFPPPACVADAASVWRWV